MTSKWAKHKKKWENCTDCELCETRYRTVLYKGYIPCDVLFVGEAPGKSENMIGKPFVGPAGHLLTRIIRLAGLLEYRLGYTNLVCCIPLDEDGNKIHDPHKEHIKACRERLEEIIKIAKPKKIVAVGKLSAKHLSRYDCSITHPGAILRMDITQRGLQVQQAVVRLEDLVEEM